MKPFSIVIFLLCVYFSNNASVDSLWKEYKKGLRSAELSGLLLDYYQSKGAYGQRDSTFRYMLQTEFDGDHERLNFLYRHYFSCENFEDNEFVIEQANEWVRSSVENKKIEDICDAYDNEFKIYWLADEMEKAFESLEKESYFAGLSGKRIYRIKALLNSGKCFEFQRKKNDAYRSYLDAYYFSLEENNKEFVKESLSAISDFFVDNKMYSKARKYKQKEIAFYLKNYQPVDSVVYFSMILNLSDHCFDNNEPKSANDYAEMVFDFCRKHPNNDLLKKQLTILRSYYFENNQLQDICNLYSIRYPTQLDTLKESDKMLYYRIKALFSEQRQDIKEAILFLDSAEAFILQPEGSLYTKSNFYNRKGEFYLRQKMYREAIAPLKEAYRYADSVAYVPFLLAVAKNLDSAYTKLQDFKSVSLLRAQIIGYNEQLASSNNHDEIVLMEVENVERQKELFQKQLETSIVRKHNLQYMFIVILIAFSFIILLIAGSFKIHRFIIKALGFFVFIFLFEFIILLADKRIEHLTHGEPLKVMGLKIVLIAFLFPLHHWVEEKVVHYLLHHRIIDNLKFREVLLSMAGRIRKMISSEEGDSAK